MKTKHILICSVIKFQNQATWISMSWYQFF